MLVCLFYDGETKMRIWKKSKRFKTRFEFESLSSLPLQSSSLNILGSERISPLGKKRDQSGLTGQEISKVLEGGTRGAVVSVYRSTRE